MKLTTTTKSILALTVAVALAACGGGGGGGSSSSTSSPLRTTPAPNAGQPISLGPETVQNKVYIRKETTTTQPTTNTGVASNQPSTTEVSAGTTTANNSTGSSATTGSTTTASTSTNASTSTGSSTADAAVSLGDNTASANAALATNTTNFGVLASALVPGIAAEYAASSPKVTATSAANIYSTLLRTNSALESFPDARKNLEALEATKSQPANYVTIADYYYYYRTNSAYEPYSKLIQDATAHGINLANKVSNFYLHAADVINWKNIIPAQQVGTNEVPVIPQANLQGLDGQLTGKGVTVVTVDSYIRPQFTQVPTSRLTFLNHDPGKSFFGQNSLDKFIHGEAVATVLTQDSPTGQALARGIDLLHYSLDARLSNLSESFGDAWERAKALGKTPFLFNLSLRAGYHSEVGQNAQLGIAPNSAIENQIVDLITKTKDAERSGNGQAPLLVFAAGNRRNGTETIVINNEELTARLVNNPEIADNTLVVMGAKFDNKSTGGMRERTFAEDNSFQCGAAKYSCIAAPWKNSFVADTSWVWGGTSFATPTVVSTAALVKEQFPWMSAKEVKTTLLTTALDVGAPGVDSVFGWGLLDTAAALRGPRALPFGDFNVNIKDGKTYYFTNPIFGDGSLNINNANNSWLVLLGEHFATGRIHVNTGNLLITDKYTAFDTLPAGYTCSSSTDSSRFFRPDGKLACGYDMNLVRAPIFVNNHGRLFALHTQLNQVVNNGYVRLGGRSSILGDYTQLGGAVLEVSLDGGNQVSVDGNILIDKDAVLRIMGSKSYRPTQQNTNTNAYYNVLGTTLDYEFKGAFGKIYTDSPLLNVKSYYSGKSLFLNLQAISAAGYVAGSYNLSVNNAMKSAGALNLDSVFSAANQATALSSALAEEGVEDFLPPADVVTDVLPPKFGNAGNPELPAVPHEDFSVSLAALADVPELVERNGKFYDKKGKEVKVREAGLAISVDPQAAQAKLTTKANKQVDKLAEAKASDLTALAGQAYAAEAETVADVTSSLARKAPTVSLEANASASSELEPAQDPNNPNASGSNGSNGSSSTVAAQPAVFKPETSDLTNLAAAIQNLNADDLNTLVARSAASVYADLALVRQQTLLASQDHFVGQTQGFAKQNGIQTYLNTAYDRQDWSQESTSLTGKLNSYAVDAGLTGQLNGVNLALAANYHRFDFSETYKDTNQLAAASASGYGAQAAVSYAFNSSLPVVLGTALAVNSTKHEVNRNLYVDDQQVSNSFNATTLASSAFVKFGLVRDVVDLDAGSSLTLVKSWQDKFAESYKADVAHENVQYLSLSAAQNQGLGLVARLWAQAGKQVTSYLNLSAGLAYQVSLKDADYRVKVQNDKLAADYQVAAYQSGQAFTPSSLLTGWAGAELTFGKFSVALTGQYQRTQNWSQKKADLTLKLGF